MLGWAAAVVAVAAGIALSPDVRAIAGGALREITVESVLVTVPVQLASTLICAAALWVLGPGVSYWGSVASRVLRDAGGNLLVIVPGLGELIGARSLVLSGGTARRALVASALDVVAETLAQIPFICLALMVLPRLGSHWDIDRSTLDWLAIGVGAGLVFAIAIWALSRRSERGLAARLLSALAAQVVAAWHEWRQRHGALPAAILLHLIAWAMGGVQVWLSARALGLPLSLVDAIILESAAYAVRAILFIVPAGVGVQEAGFVVAGSAFGLSPEQSLGLSLVLRARDVLLGVPVLLLWPVAEWRGQKAVGGPAGGG
ncbi:hypothetical protein SCH01S_45_00870 [Sphingomonas changbaiensis NBRC 104936]|uniref:Uncharacterized protein n=2 Tax=Sphingomonas changbaiensis TaxID=529705 RepID=A0A0E9MRQ8_9SPHN|nr:hypothetical protein SCH01S_45_00870 [Sphingomonas changbaiensis NBRC 104936]